MSKTNLIVIILSFIISTSAILAYTIYRIKIVSDEDITLYEKEEKEKVKQNLKDYIDIAYSVIESHHKKSSIESKYLEEIYGHRLKNIIDVAYTTLNLKAELVKKGKLTLAEAQAQAADEIKQIRYDGGTGYIFIVDTTLPPKVIMNPIKPSLDGQVMDDPKYHTALDKQNFFVAFVEVAKTKGNGFVKHKFTKPTQDGGEISNVPKLSYVKLFPEWNWIIGTGIYIDDIIRESIKDIKNIIRTMKYNNNVGYFWIIDVSDKSSPKYAMHPHDSSREGKILKGKLSKLKTRVDSFIEACEKEGNGYVDYNGEKPTEQGLIQGAPKSTYVRLYKPLNWIIGTGFYMDGIDKTVAKKKKAIKQRIDTLIYNILIATLSIALLIGTLNYLIRHYFFKTKPKVADGREKIPTSKSKKSNQIKIPNKTVSNEALSLTLKKHVSLSMGVALIPIPIVDFVSVTAIQMSLLSEIAEKFGVPFSKEKVKSLLFSLVGGSIPVAANMPVASMIKSIPVIGTVSGLITMPIISGASTYAIGKLFIQHFADGGTFSNFEPQNAKEDYAKMSEDGMKIASDLAKKRA
ncbi:MAG: cache domain-containing protein [Thiomargarita sp.]|nr:cache domain-containing protein [Thiomargarita sp.]